MTGYTASLPIDIKEKAIKIKLAHGAATFLVAELKPYVCSAMFVAQHLTTVLAVVIFATLLQ